MSAIRIGVIGLGWFGEIHCETIVGVPSLELAALCTRTPGPAEAAWRRNSACSKTYADYRDMLADPEIDAVSIVTMWDQHTEPAVAALEAGKHVFLEKPMASTVADAQKIMAAGASGEGRSCRSATSAASTRATAWPSRRSTQGKIGKIVSMSSRRNIPAAWTPEILNKIGPIVGDAIHDTDLMLWFTGDRDRQRLCADGRRARPQASRHRADHVPLRRRRDRDLGDGLVHAREDAVRHRRAHVDHRHRGLHPCPGHVSEPRHRLRATSCTAPTPPIGRCSTACAAARCEEEFAYFADCALKGRSAGDRQAGGRRRGARRRRSPPRNRRAPVRS